MRPILPIVRAYLILFLCACIGMILGPIADAVHSAAVEKYNASITLGWDYLPDPMVDGFILHWGNIPGRYAHSLNVGDTNQCTVLISEKQPLYFALTAYYTNLNPDVECSNFPSVQSVPSVAHQICHTNWLIESAPSAEVPLLTTNLQPFCWTDTTNAHVIAWGTAGYQYTFLAGTTPLAMTNPVSTIDGTNGPITYTEPLQQQRFYTIERHELSAD